MEINKAFIHIISLNLDENNTKRKRVSTKIFTDKDHAKKQLTGIKIKTFRTKDKGCNRQWK